PRQAEGIQARRERQRNGLDRHYRGPLPRWHAEGPGPAACTLSAVTVTVAPPCWPPNRTRQARCHSQRPQRCCQANTAAQGRASPCAGERHTLRLASAFGSAGSVTRVALTVHGEIELVGCH